MIKNNISLTISLIALIIANFISIHIFIKAINTTKKLSAIKAKNEMIDFRNKYLNQLYDSNFSFMHSTIRTLLKIQNHLEEKNYEQFQSELLNLNHHILTNFNVINSSSAIISTIINSNLKRIKENKIDFKSVLEFNDFSFLGLQDQQEIFELLLNIGFSSCSKSQSNSKIVILKTALKNNQIFIQLLFTNGNNSNPPIFQDDLCKIYKIINKYNGTLTLDENFDKDGSSILVLLPYTSACPC
ncbi:hypothetical protein EOM09_05415 [bacterium]|nr:hypothetical protein [bacterium]